MSRESNLLYYQTLFDSMTELPDKIWVDRINRDVEHIIKHRSTYELGVEGSNVPWYFVAVIHSMESSCDFKCQIANGQKWTEKTTLVPENIGPWDSWIDSTKDIIKQSKMDVVTWTIPHMLLYLESYNGWGYKNRGKHSPYLWSGSNHGVGLGKYVEKFINGKRKSVYVETLESDQVGSAVLIRRLLCDDYPRVVSEVPCM